MVPNCSAPPCAAQSQRPNIRRASGIGMWLKVLHFMSIAAVLTNCALIAFASNQV